MANLISELKRRNVFRIAVVYLVASWLLLQIADIVFPVLKIPEWGMRLLLILLIFGFPLAVLLAWMFELTPQGIQKDTRSSGDEPVLAKDNHRIDYAIIGLLAVALVYFIYKSEFPSPTMDQAAISETGPGVAEAIDDQSIAVLPFTNRSANEEDAAFFADGVHDDLLTRLSKVADLKVISRTSVEQYRNTTKPIPEIAKELGVGTVLEGAVQRAGNRVRIYAQLIDATTDEHLWAETYDEQLTAENIFDIQQRISHAIADALQATLTNEEQIALSLIPTMHLPAYDAYLLGRQKLYRYTVASNQDAEEDFQRAISIDPDFALAYVGLAESRLNQIQITGGPFVDYANLAVRIDHEVGATIAKALRLAPDLGEAHAVKAQADRSGGRFEIAEPSFQRALELNPNYWPAYLQYGSLLMEVRRPDEALPLFLKAVELDPNSAATHAELGAAYHARGDLDAALVQFEKAISLDSKDASLYLQMGNLHEDLNGRLDQAFPYFLKAYELDPLNEFNLLKIGNIYLDLMDVDAAQRWLDDIRARGMNNAANLLQIHVFLYSGDKEKAASLVEQFYTQTTSTMGMHHLLVDRAIQTGQYDKPLGFFRSSYPQLFLSERPLVDSRVDRAALGLACLYQHMGENEKAQHFLDGSTKVLSTGQRSGPGRYDIGYQYALVENYALRGQYDDALTELRNWKDDGGRAGWWRLKNIPCLEPLWDRPEYIQVMDEIEQDMIQQRQNLKDQGIG